MKNNFVSSGPIQPAHENDDIQVVELKSFADFDRWMDEQLELLVARWAPLAAPNASRIPTPRQRGAQDE